MKKVIVTIGMTLMLVSTPLAQTLIPAYEPITEWYYEPAAFNNMYKGYLGVAVTAGADDMLITRLGRYSHDGLYRKNHLLYVLNVDHTTNGVIALPKTHVTKTFVWAPLTNQVIIPAGHTNYIVTETGEGDTYADSMGLPLSDTNVVKAFSCFGPTLNTIVSWAPNQIYGPVNYER